MKNPKVFIVIVNFNGGALLHAAVASAHAAHYPQKDVLVVDNHSSDNSIQKVRTDFPATHIITKNTNDGFAAGANCGMRYALSHGARHVLLLNPDATIAPDMLTHLVQACNTTKNAIANPLIFFHGTKKPWYANGRITALRMRTVHAHTLPHDTKKTHRSGYATGCVMLVSREVLKQVGFFDERFFLYYEDADLSTRAHKKDYATVVVPQAHAWHRESSTVETEEKVYHLVLSGLLFFHKHATPLSRLWFFGYTCARRAKNTVTLRWRPSPSARAAKRAYQHYAQLHTYF